MSENKEYMTHPEELGCIHISEEVLASLASGAVAEVEGLVFRSQGLEIGAGQTLLQQLPGGQAGEAQLIAEMHGDLSGNISNHGRSFSLSIHTTRRFLLEGHAAYMDVDRLHREAGHGFQGARGGG